jgi:hypothetical protein
MLLQPEAIVDLSLELDSRTFGMRTPTGFKKDMQFAMEVLKEHDAPRGCGSDRARRPYAPPKLGHAGQPRRVKRAVQRPVQAACAPRRRVSVRYSEAKAGGSNSIIPVFSIQTSITWKPPAPRSQQ